MQAKHTAAIVGALVSLSGTAHGGEVGGTIDSNWNQGFSGLWSNPQAWDPFGVPNNFPPQQIFYNATIDRVSKPYQVFLDIDVELQNFTLDFADATLDLAFSSMTVNENFSLLSGTIKRTPGKKEPPETVVNGVLRLSDGALMGAGTIISNGSIIFGAGGGEGENRNVDICNTGVDHRGTGSIRMDGGTDIQFNEGGSLTNNADASIDIGETGGVDISGDGSGTIDNQGELRNIGGTSRGVGKLEVTSISGVNFFNNGTVTVFSSELRLQPTNPLTGKGALVDGVWNVNFGNLNFVDSPIGALGTEVNIFGSDSQFNAINALTQILSEGKFQIASGKNFVVGQSLFNGGEIKVGSGSTFDSTSGLDNLKGNSLLGGKFVVAGSFLSGTEGGSGIYFLGSDVTLDGPDSVFTGIEVLGEIGGGGRLALEGGRTFSTFGDLNVNDGGTVRVGAGSSLTINGNLNNNDPGGLFSDGVFDIEGTFSAQNLNIVEISNEIILDGPDSVLLNGLGEDALSQLERITETGILRLRNGRTIEDLEDLIVDGILCIDGVTAPERGLPLMDRGFGFVGALVTDTASFGADSTLEFIINGDSPDEHGQLYAWDSVDVTPGAKIQLMIGEDATLDVGDVVFLVQTDLMTGTFEVVAPEGADPDVVLGFEVDQSEDGVSARVVSLSCPADLAPPTGVLNFFDIAQFIQDFLDQGPTGDFNGDGQYDFFDVSEFVVSFGRGCP